MTQNEFSAGVTLRGDESYEGEFRVTRDSALIISDGHARWYEQGSRGQIYSVITTQQGNVLVPDNTAPPAAGAITVLSILNPVGSGVNLEILQGWVAWIAGTPQPGLWAWCGAVAGMSITAAEAGATKGALRYPSDVPHVKAWSQVALTGGPAHTNVRPFPMTLFNAGIAAGGTSDLLIADSVDGALTVLPGGLITLAPALAITGPPTAAAAAGILFAEVPRSPRSA